MSERQLPEVPVSPPVNSIVPGFHVHIRDVKPQRKQEPEKTGVRDFLKKVFSPAVRSVVLVIGGAATSLGLIPDGVAEGIVNNAEAVVSGILIAWGAIAGIRSDLGKILKRGE